MGYCTQDDIEKYLKTTFDANDETIAALIDHVTAMIDSYCGRDFLAHTGEVEYHDGKGRGHNVIMLKNYPVTAVTEVVEDGTTLTANEDYIWYADGRIVKCVNGLVDPNTTYWKAKLKAIKVTYNYGYSTVPTEIKSVCIQLCVEWLKKYALKFADVGAAESVSLAGITVTYSEHEILPDWAQKRLEHYKKRLTW